MKGDRIGAHDTLLTPGTRLRPYEIDSLIGSGGMGEVYKAHDGRLNRTVADQAVDRRRCDRFQTISATVAGSVPCRQAV